MSWGQLTFAYQSSKIKYIPHKPRIFELAANQWYN